MPELLPRIPRVEALLGCRLADVDSGVLTRIVSNRLREDTDIEFKGQVYGASDAERRNAAGDVAAMANGSGGVIMLGIAEGGGAASAVTPVPLSEETELRLRQSIVGLTAPAPYFVIHRVPISGENGVYLLIVPASPDAPHAVRVNDALRYVQRDGARIRVLPESEVADRYRRRLERARADVDRADQMLEFAQPLLDPEQSWLVAVLVPAVPGRIEIRRRTLAEANQRWYARWSSDEFGRRVFGDTGVYAEAGVGRVILSSVRDGNNRISRFGHAELYADGSGLAAVRLWGPIDRTRAPAGIPPENVYVDEENLVDRAVALVGLLGEHASVHAGVAGDAITRMRIVPRHNVGILLSHFRTFGAMSVLGTMQPLRDFEWPPHVVALEDLLEQRGRLIAARLLLTDIVQAFGLAEVHQITPAGALRIRYFNEQNAQQFRRWAPSNHVEVVESTLDME